MSNNQTTFTLNIKALFDASQVASGAKQIQDIFKQIKLPSNLQSDFNKAFSNLESSVNKVQQKYEQGFKTKGDVSSYEKAFKEMENAATQYEKVIQRIQNEVGTSVDLSKIIKWDSSTTEKLKELENRITEFKAKMNFSGTDDSAFKSISDALKQITSTAPATTKAVDEFKQALLSGDLQTAEEQLTKLENIWKRFGEGNTNFEGVKALRRAFDELKSSGIFAELEKLYSQKGDIQTGAWKNMAAQIEKAAGSVGKFSSAAGQAKGQLTGMASAQQAWNNSVDQFKSRIQYFFGLNNIIQLVKRSIREAFNTVKELDAAMAKTAVVTKYDISDMWNQLPQYTQLANQLGVTTKGAYETMTLFYQQGLDTNQAFALGTETMKMARIAGLDYATATDYMTAALRGFNMELNELSAQRVNDVYSRLAATTASNTQEISTAMTKVASLAHNANMEFETTSAFLAQIIETTRESAETAGTALKTVVARFSEVKKLVNESQLTGQDEEGQVIDVNKVSAALRTAGIDMNKYFLGEVGLDDIFVELASKWDSLTSVQQRYIATQAAGSRQQSRFIAMMSNYKRTQELIGEAYNSNGASEKQFEKTQESLETALNRLNNAWDQFTMNLANNDAIRGVITALTQLLEILNKVTSVFNSGWRSIITGGMTLGALFGGGRLVNAAFSASKIVKANDITWGKAFANQLGRNPKLYDVSSGELTGASRQRFHLFGQGGFFSPNIRQVQAPDLSEERLLKDYREWQEQQQGNPSGSTSPTSNSREEWMEKRKAELEQEYKNESEAAQRQQISLQHQRRAGGYMAAAGLAFSAAGSAISKNAETIATSLDKSEESVEKFGSGLSKVGTSLSMAGMMFMLLPPGINAVAAAITVLIGVFAAFHPETAAESLKRLTEESKQADQMAKDTKQAYEDLLSKAEHHNELLNEISKLKEGTLEFRKAILDANEAALELINNYNLTPNDYTRDKNGLIMFNPGVLEQAQKDQLQLAEKTQQLSSVARLSVSSQQAVIDQKKDDHLEHIEAGLKEILDNDSGRMGEFLRAAQDNSNKILGSHSSWLGENVTWTNITGRDIAAAAEKRGYGSDYDRYLKDVADGKVGPEVPESLKNDYQAALTNAVGSEVTPAIELGIAQLVDSFSPEEYNQDRKEIERTVDAMGSSEARRQYREKVGEIIGDIPLDQIKDELAQAMIAEKLKTDAIDAGTKAQEKANTELLNYKKLTTSQIAKLKEDNLDDTYAQLVGKQAQEQMTETARTLAEFTSADNPWAYLGNYTIDQNKQIAQAGKSLGTTFGKKTADAVVTEIKKGLNNKDSSLLDSVLSANFSGEYGALSTNLKTLKGLFKDDEQGAKIFNMALQEVGGQAALFQSFYYNNQDVIESLNKMADAAGNISADAILDAADSCEELSDWLEEGTTNAAGLAAALSDINLNELNAEQISDTLLKAYSVAESVSQVIAQADSVLNNWKEMPSGARFAEWGTKGAKSITEAWSAGRYQDQQARQYLEAMLPTSAMRKYNQVMSSAGDKAWKDSAEAALTFINANLGEEIDLFQQLQEAGNLSPLYAYYEKNAKAAADSTVQFKDGMVNFADSIKTAEEALQVLLDIGINEDLASIMLGDFINNSPDAIVKWSQNAAEAGIDVFKDKIADGGLVLDGELSKYYNKYAQFFDENDPKWGNYEDWKEHFFGGNESQIINLKANWVDGKDPIQTLNDAFKDVSGGLKGFFEKRDVFNTKDINIGTGGQIISATDFSSINLDNLLATFQALGATEAQAISLADQYAQSIKDAGGEFNGFSASYQKWDYNADTKKWESSTAWIKDQATAVEALTAAQNEAQASLMEMQAQMNAQAFQDMLTGLSDDGVDIDFSANDEKYQSTVQQIKQTNEELENDPVEIPIEAKSDTEEIVDDAVAAVAEIDEQQANVDISADPAPALQPIQEVENEKEEVETPAEVEITANAEEAISTIVEVKGLLDSIPRNINVTITASKAGDGWEAAGLGSGASGGVVNSYASGTNHLSPGPALTGEEGPEIVWNKNKGYAYVTGENHPEFQNLQPGDRVFNAQETKKILGGAASGGKVPSLATGYLPGIGGSTSGGGGGRGGGGGGDGSEEEPNEWKNELDWLYNLMEDIVELERDQKAIEEQYEDYLKDQSKTGKDLYNLLIKQLGNLYTQLEHQQFALEKREQEMREFMDVTNDKDKYLWYNWQDRTLEIDWDAIDKIRDEEQYKHVKDLIDEAEEIQDKIDDADDAIMDITNQIQELENIWRDTYVDFEKRVLDAIVKSYQKIIDQYSDLNDTLNDSNSKILDSLQKEIDLQRQIRDNTKTEEEISDDEARLAYLKRDTSGGNEVDILALEKELNDKRENYTDTLIDQAINKLQEDNESASQQRERQIEIMQAQLDYQSENGLFNEYLRELLTTAMGADGELLTNSDLLSLLKEQENWNAMTDVQQQVWEEELNGTFKEVVAFLLKQNAEENGIFYTALTAAVDSVSAAIGSYSQAIVKLGNMMTHQGGPSDAGGGGGGGDSGGGKPPQSTYNAFAKAGGGYDYPTFIVKHEKGGLNTTTGFAWLDGTPQDPEYVLNARQTDAFLRLADVLPSMMGSGGGNTTTSFGNNQFNVSIHVDQLASDYDVDRMVERVKDKLYETASYRNVNSLSFIR